MVACGAAQPLHGGQRRGGLRSGISMTQKSDFFSKDKAEWMTLHFRCHPVPQIHLGEFHTVQDSQAGRGSSL